jgi:hypothetical protein
MEAEWSQQARTPISPKVLEQRLSVGIRRIPAKLSHSSKLELGNPVDRWRTPAEASHLSYEEGSWQAGRPSGPKSLATLPTRLRLATTLRIGTLQVESPKCGVFPEFYCEDAYIELKGSFHWLIRVGLEVMDDRSAIDEAGRPLLSVSTDFRTLDTLANWLTSVAIKSQPEPTQSVAGWPLCPFDLWFSPTWSMCHKHSCSDTIFGGIPNVLVISWNAPI